MSDYTPSTETVRDCFIEGAEGSFIGEDFDRWLEDVKEKAWQAGWDEAAGWAEWDSLGEDL